MLAIKLDASGEWLPDRFTINEIAIGQPLEIDKQRRKVPKVSAARRHRRNSAGDDFVDRIETYHGKTFRQKHAKTQLCARIGPRMLVWRHLKRFISVSPCRNKETGQRTRGLPWPIDAKPFRSADCLGVKLTFARDSSKLHCG